MLRVPSRLSSAWLRPIEQPPATQSRKALLRDLDSGWWLCGLLVAVGGLVRWQGLNRQSMWIDEMSSLGMAFNGLRQIVPIILAYDGHPPLYILTVHVAHYFFGLDPVHALRIPSLLAGAASIAVVYALARILVGRIAGLVAATLVAVSPLAVWYSREGRMYAMVWLFVLLSFLILVQAIRSENWYWLPPFAALIALSLYTDISAVMALLPLGVMIAALFVLQPEKRLLWLRIGTTYAAGWALFVPWIAVMSRQVPLLQARFPGYDPSPATAWRLILNVLGLSAAYASLESLLVPSAVAALLIAVYGGAFVLTFILSRHRYLFRAVALSLTIGPGIMCALFVAHGTAGVLLPRVVGIASFGLAIVAGGASELAWQSLKTRAKAAPIPLVAATFVLIAGTVVSLTIVESRGSNGQPWREVAHFIAGHAKAGDALIYYPYGLKLVVDAYLPQSSPWTEQGVGIWASPDEVAHGHFERWALHRERVWVVFYAGPGINMPLHDSWFQQQGYARLSGDPSAGMGVIEYSPGQIR